MGRIKDGVYVLICTIDLTSLFTQLLALYPHNKIIVAHAVLVGP